VEVSLLLALLAGAACAAPSEPPPQPPAATAAAAEEGPDYPLGPGRVPDFNAPGDPFTLSDLSFHLEDTFATSQSFAARVRFKDVGYLGASFDGERRGLRLTTHRLELSAVSDNGSWDLTADFRARRFVLSSVARSLGGPAGALLEESLAVRITPDLELSGWVVGDTSRPDKRFLREAAASLLWQRGARLEASGQYVRSFESTEAGENRVHSGLFTLVAQLGPAELTGSASLRDTQGRFPRRESETAGQLRLSLAPRLLLEAGARELFEAGAGARRHEYRGGISWLARRYTLPRAGERARRAVELARRATEAGEYELRVFDDDAIRAQRERLSLSPQRERLRSDMEALYRAQVDERLVPLAGASLVQREDALSAERTLVAGAFAALPWPPSWPWHAQGSVPFLRLDLEHERHTSAVSFRDETNSARLTVTLSRELDLVARFTRREPSALDLIRGVGRRDTFELSCVYARGR
jgi:hypothetical protein